MNEMKKKYINNVKIKLMVQWLSKHKTEENKRCKTYIYR